MKGSNLNFFPKPPPALHPLPMSYLTFACPLCQQAFQADADHLGQSVSCPHCEQPIALPMGIPAAADASSTGDAPPPPPAIDATNSSTSTTVRVSETGRRTLRAGNEIIEVKELTPKQRAAFRRRVNLVVSVVCAVVLMSAVAGLLWWRG